MSNHYDVIIVGGRNAGSSLAMRLAKYDLKVLLVDRANFPSLPQVPSSPMIHAGTMRLLDELGMKEEEYAYADAKIEGFALSFVGHFTTVMPTKAMGIDRNYNYGIDRNRFDTVFFEKAGKTPNVTAYSNFSVTGVQKENGRVTGITGKDGEGKEHSFTTDLLVGADGRFSWTARAVGAKVVEERNEYMGSTYQAEWEGVAPLSEEHPNTVTFYNTAKGFVVLLIPIGNGRHIVANYMTKDKLNFGPHQLEDHYLDGMKSVPDAWARLKNAKRVTDIVGMKGIQNGYREAFGEGWALAGDAVHYKDPVDGQGIYDALLGTKYLAEAIHMWKIQGCDFEESMNHYKENLWNETHPMFEQTVARVKQEAYTEPPPFIIKTIIRWTVTDPEYQANFLRYLHRAIDPSQRPNPHPKYFIRGLMRDLFGKKN
jgi:flavin-dependent dehydrogenase